MFRIYFKAQKHGLIPCKEETNPVNWVEQSGKSYYKAVIVTPGQAFKIMMALPESERVLTLVIAATGLRISEALGLQWQDVDYANQRINLPRVWVDNKVVEHMKTEQSEAPATLRPHVGGGLTVLAPADRLRATERLDLCLLQIEGASAANGQHSCSRSSSSRCYRGWGCAEVGAAFRFP